MLADSLRFSREVTQNRRAVLKTAFYQILDLSIQDQKISKGPTLYKKESSDESKQGSALKSPMGAM